MVLRQRSKRRILGASVAVAVALVGFPIVHAAAKSSSSGAASAAADRTLRVYNNNIENLVVNKSGGACSRISGPSHLKSMLVDANGKTGTSGVKAPDLLTVQQIRGSGQATAYADQLSRKFGYAEGTYKAIVVWKDPQSWGGSHKCNDQSLGNRKKKQTNALIYNSKRLSLVEVSKYWSAGWLKPGTSYRDGKGCTLYKPPNNDSKASLKYKYKRTSAIAAKFKIKSTGTTVFAATMHLPQENRKHACGGKGSKGIKGSGIHIAADARRLMESSTIRIVGIDANRTGISANTLSGYGMKGYGSKPTHSKSKIDYLFIKGSVQKSPVDHTVKGTKSNHLALYGFINF